MLSEIAKIEYLKKYLNLPSEHYADSFKSDIALFLGDYNLIDSKLKFIHELNSIEEIESWVDKLTARIVLKFDEESEQLSDFIFEFVEIKKAKEN